MIVIRPYSEKADFKMLTSWWKTTDEPAPTKDMYPDSTYILEIDGEPALSAWIYLFNCKSVAMLEGFIGNPDLKGIERREAAPILIAFLETVAKDKGYDSLFALAHKDSLKQYYTTFGYTETLSTLSSFSKKL